MSTRGSEGERIIAAKINELQSEENELVRTINSYEKRITSLMDERENCFHTLALIYLPELSAKSVETTLRQVQTQVKDTFRQKQSHREGLETLMKSALSDKTILEERLERVNQGLNKNSEQKDETIKRIEGYLSERSDYLKLKVEVQGKQKDLDERKTILESFKADAKRKLQAYTSNELFMYLVGRNFGKPSYSHKGLIRNRDMNVAKLVKWEEHKKDYDCLIMMPKLMQAEIDKRQEGYRKVASEFNRIIKEIQDNYGLTKVIKEEEKLIEDRKRILSEIEQKEEMCQKFSKERKELDSTKGDYHQRAIQKIKDFLKGDVITGLKKIAMETPDQRDDDLVDKISQIDLEVRSLKDNAKQTILSRDTVSQKLNDLNHILSRYRSNNYDGSRSYFDSSFNMDSLITGYLLGRTSSHSVWSGIESSQRFKSEDSYSSSSSSSSSFDFSSGGGCGGGSFSSGSGF